MLAFTQRLPVIVNLTSSLSGSIPVCKNILNNGCAKLYSSQLCKPFHWSLISDITNDISIGLKLTQRAATFSNHEKIFSRGYALFPSTKIHLLCREGGLDKSCNLNQTVRNLTVHHIGRPSPETTRKNLRYKVHYPKDGKYTIQPLPITKLGGRDPDTGRIIFGKIGGGSKRRFRWVIFDRVPPGSKDPLIERVMQVQHDPNRTARIALVGHDDKLRYIIATADMKKGDLITSTRCIPRMHVRPKNGDAHPVGALPSGTTVCCIETIPGHGAMVKLAAGTSGIVTGKFGEKVIVQLDSLREMALDPNCLATVGQVSNVDYNKKHIGSPNRMRWLGIRPGSGLWQRKDGRYGFKRRYKKPPMHFEPKKPSTPVVNLTLLSVQSRRRIIPATNRVT